MTTEVKPPNICGAKKRGGPGICRKPSGWGTKHAGTGRCKLHGGSNTGPKDTSKTRFNGVKHGGRASAAYFEYLNAQEKKVYEEENVEVMSQLDDEIRLVSIRERRMMERIHNLVEAGPWSIVGIKTKGYEYYKSFEEFRKDLLDRGQAVQLKRDIDEEWTGTLGQIQAIEVELTKVQDKKAKLLDLKYRIEQTSGPAADNRKALADYRAALESAGGDVWNDYEE